MIKVNWSKIKKFEKKPFAFATIGAELIISIILFIVGLATHVTPINYFSALFIMFIVAFYVHIESRMIQIYMLLCVLDIAQILFTFVYISKEASLSAFLVVTAILLITVILSLIVKSYITENTKYKPTESSNSKIFKNKSAMFFVPHEDDEINVFGGVLEQYVKNGSDVKIVFLTNGDCYGIEKFRIIEALDVAKVYNIPKENIIFLGYSDTLSKHGVHIYNAEDNEEYTSVKGHTETYATKHMNPFKIGRMFTRSNIVEDMKDVIKAYKPDELFCCDYDSHPDHRAISLFFEEALDELLKEDASYTPDVYKGFAYSTAWNGKQDYYSLNIVSTRKVSNSPLMEENNIYEWNERVRFPVADETLSRVMQNSSSYQAMMMHCSQTASDHANGILNGDKVFWKRRTDNVLKNAEIIATSGDASQVTSFKLADSENIMKSDNLPCSNVWEADENDENRIIMISLPEPKTIREVVIYANPYNENNIINATLKVGNYQFETDMIDNYSVFEFDEITTDKLALRIDEFTGVASVLKIEAYETPSDDETRIIKVMNRNFDFCYDYFIKKGGKEELFVYTYPENAENEYEISTDGNIEAEFTDNGILVKCKQNECGKLRVSLKDKPEIFDEINISNPEDKKRTQLKFKQMLEHAVYSIPMQKDYYLGLIRRMGVYK
ncbi:MAG: PIG-L family deacetylase [Eubacterium sp.]|nr:PIG-L family deacetylase [Eubacterium sp.]